MGPRAVLIRYAPRFIRDNVRSEEHTSELQSSCNLVCRLLLEKKKTRPKTRGFLPPPPPPPPPDRPPPRLPPPPPTPFVFRRLSFLPSTLTSALPYSIPWRGNR